MTSGNDGMDWLDEAPSEAMSPDDARAFALDSVGNSARLALFNVVKRAFSQLQSSEHLSRQDLAGRLGASRNLVSRWLLRPTNMTIETAARLMHVMGKELQITERSAQPALALTMHRIDLPARTEMSASGSGNCSVAVVQGSSPRIVRIEGANADGVYEQVGNLFSRTSTTPTIRPRETESA